VGWDSFRDNRDKIRSRAGGWAADGSAILYGFDTHHELTPNATFMQTMILACTGRMYLANEARLIEAMHVVTGYPDPRLWCNRVAALAGTARTPPAAALTAGLASSEAKVYGCQSAFQAANTILKATQIYSDKGDSGLARYLIDQIKKHRSVFGYGRPIVHVEERIAPIDSFAQQLGIEDGLHLKVARIIEDKLKKYRLIMNFAGYASARFLDMGFSPIEIYRFTVHSLYIGLLPCYTEAFDNEPGTFLPIACEDILYEGREERPLPE